MWPHISWDIVQAKPVFTQCIQELVDGLTDPNIRRWFEQACLRNGGFHLTWVVFNSIGQVSPVLCNLRQLTCQQLTHSCCLTQQSYSNLPTSLRRNTTAPLTNTRYMRLIRATASTALTSFAPSLAVSDPPQRVVKESSRQSSTWSAWRNEPLTK